MAGHENPPPKKKKKNKQKLTPKPPPPPPAQCQGKLGVTKQPRWASYFGEGPRGGGVPHLSL
jgi:hypothetical protein